VECNGVRPSERIEKAINREWTPAHQKALEQNGTLQDQLLEALWDGTVPLELF
jgi:hypothetical protein